MIDVLPSALSKKKTHYIDQLSLLEKTNVIRGPFKTCHHYVTYLQNFKVGQPGKRIGGKSCEWVIVEVPKQAENVWFVHTISPFKTKKINNSLVYIRRKIKTTIPVAKDVYIRPTSISFLRFCQRTATDVVVVAGLRDVFFVSPFIAACSRGSFSLRKQFIPASPGFYPNGG